MIIVYKNTLLKTQTHTQACGGGGGGGGGRGGGGSGGGRGGGDGGGAGKVRVGHRHHHRHHRTLVCASEFLEVYPGMEPVYTVYTVYTMYYYNTRIKSTKTQALCTLKISFDIVFDALFDRGCHPIQPLPNICFYKYGHNSGQKCIPRHDSDDIRCEISRDKR